MNREAIMWFGDDEDFKTCGLDPSKFTDNEKIQIRETLEFLADSKYQSLVLDAAERAIGATLATHGLEG